MEMQFFGTIFMQINYKYEHISDACSEEHYFLYWNKLNIFIYCRVLDSACALLLSLRNKILTMNS